MDEKDLKIAELEAEAEKARPKIQLSEYKGHKTVLFTGAFVPFAFGLSKARTVVRFADQLKRFVESEGKEL